MMPSSKPLSSDASSCWQRPQLWGMAVSLLVAGLFAACDVVTPSEEDRLVLEAFFVSEKPVAAVQLRRTAPLDAARASASPVSGASLALAMGGEQRPLVENSGRAGRYRPETSLRAQAGADFSLKVQWQGVEARAVGTIPPPITIDSLQVSAPDRPVEAVLLDSLRLDSLRLDVEEGFIYPVEVDLWWHGDETDVDERWWIRTQLRPEANFSSAVVDFFLREEDVFQEQEAQEEAGVRRRWTGIYAVRVEGAHDPLPEHRLRVALLRSGQDYARFVTSRDDPTRREPHSNVEGALGIVAGIALDSTAVFVE